jgi:hypothetical protein
VLDWAREFLAGSHPELGRTGPVCPYIRHSIDERQLYVLCRPDLVCNGDGLASAIRQSKQWFTELRRRTPREKRHLVAIVVVLPRIDRTSSEPLDALHAVLKDEFVSSGLMLGQFHPTCDAPGLRNPDFRPLRSPIPFLAIREMVSSDLPFLVGNPLHAAAYFDRFAPSIPAHTRRYLVDRLVTSPDGQGR